MESLLPNHWDQWFFNCCSARQPLVSMVFDGRPLSFWGYIIAKVYIQCIDEGGKVWKLWGEVGGCVCYLGLREACLWMNFRKISEQPLTPPPIPTVPFLGKNVAIFSTKFFRSEMTLPKQFLCLIPKVLQRNFLDQKMPPHLWKFSGNSSILVETGFPYKNCCFNVWGNIDSLL